MSFSPILGKTLRSYATKYDVNWDNKIDLEEAKAASTALSGSSSAAKRNIGQFFNKLASELESSPQRLENFLGSGFTYTGTSNALDRLAALNNPATIESGDFAAIPRIVTDTSSAPTAPNEFSVKLEGAIYSENNEIILSGNGWKAFVNDPSYQLTQANIRALQAAAPNESASLFLNTLGQNFKKIDTNQDGILNTGELTRLSNYASPYNTITKTDFKILGHSEKIDTNQDGTLSSRELEDLRKGTGDPNKLEDTDFDYLYGQRVFQEGPSLTNPSQFSVELNNSTTRPILTGNGWKAYLAGYPLNKANIITLKEQSPTESARLFFGELENHFDQMDTSQDGVLSYNEFSIAAGKMGDHRKVEKNDFDYLAGKRIFEGSAAPAYLESSAVRLAKINYHTGEFWLQGKTWEASIDLEHPLTQSQIEALKAAAPNDSARSFLDKLGHPSHFNTIDINKDGKLSHSELSNFAASAGTPYYATSERTSAIHDIQQEDFDLLNGILPSATQVSQDFFANASTINESMGKSDNEGLTRNDMLRAVTDLIGHAETRRLFTYMLTHPATFPLIDRNGNDKIEKEEWQHLGRSWSGPNPFSTSILDQMKQAVHSGAITIEDFNAYPPLPEPNPPKLQQELQNTNQNDPAPSNPQQILLS